MGKLGFYIDMTACIGCKTCQMACKDKNDLEIGIIFRRVKTFETGKYPNPGVYHYSGSCNHCTEAKCVKGCPTGAMHYGEDKTVQHDPELCIGCKYCTWNCPYSVPQYRESKNIVGKCDMCMDLRKAGENPACVDACVMRCLKIGDLDELEKEYGFDLVSDLPILPPSDITEPSLLIKPKVIALDSNYKEKEV